MDKYIKEHKKKFFFDPYIYFNYEHTKKGWSHPLKKKSNTLTDVEFTLEFTRTIEKFYKIAKWKKFVEKGLFFVLLEALKIFVFFVTKVIINFHVNKRAIFWWVVYKLKIIEVCFLKMKLNNFFNSSISFKNSFNLPFTYSLFTQRIFWVFYNFTSKHKKGWHWR